MLDVSLSSYQNAVGTQHQMVSEPHLQLLWCILYFSLSMVTYGQNRKRPANKQLALYTALAIITRLSSNTNRPKWIVSHTSEWKKVGEDICTFGTENELSAVKEYLLEQASSEAWTTDPFTRDKFNVLQNAITINLQADNAIENEHTQRKKLETVGRVELQSDSNAIENE